MTNKKTTDNSHLLQETRGPTATEEDALKQHTFYGADGNDYGIKADRIVSDEFRDQVLNDEKVEVTMADTQIDDLNLPPLDNIVLRVKIDRSLYDEIKWSSKITGRTVTEEIVYRVQESIDMPAAMMARPGKAENDPNAPVEPLVPYDCVITLLKGPPGSTELVTSFQSYLHLVSGVGIIKRGDRTFVFAQHLSNMRTVVFIESETMTIPDTL